jgi:uncharacterized lipoprotein NlpE involved in copper resistance
MSKTILTLIVIVMLSLLGCGKKEQENPQEVQARRDSATTICLDKVKAWCTGVTGDAEMQVTNCHYVPGLYQETEEIRGLRINAFAITTAFKGQVCGDKAVRTKWVFDCQVKRTSDALVEFKIIKPNAKLSYTIENCVN